MKITHNKVGQNLSLKDTGKSDKAGAAGAADKSGKAGPAAALKEGGSPGVELEASKVEISTRAQDIRKAKELAMAAPDVDQEKVNRIQKLIDNGNYKVDAGAIADKMVDEHMNWE